VQQSLTCSRCEEGGEGGRGGGERAGLDLVWTNTTSLDQARATAPQVGIQRSNFTGLFTYLTGAAAPQEASELPYGHWAWKQQSLAAVQGYNCTLAWKDLAYGRCGMTMHY
jgi:hypothetical protein